MTPQRSALVTERDRAPLGYIDLRSARTYVLHRVFSSAMPREVLAAAEQNVLHAASPSASICREPPPESPRPETFIVDALRSDLLKLYIYSSTGYDVIQIPTQYVEVVTEKVGYVKISKETISYRFMNFYPISLLQSLNISGLENVRVDRFALCLKEKHFFAWLADTARRLRWPIDVKRQAGPGRPRLFESLTPVLQGLVESSRWQQGMPLTRLVGLIRAQTRDAKVDRETVKKAMDMLYEETGSNAYRYVRKLRRTSTKRKKRSN